MRITRRLSWLLIVFMLVAITFTIGYSILFIRDYMFESELKEMQLHLQYGKDLEHIAHFKGYQLKELHATGQSPSTWMTEDSLHANHTIGNTNVILSLPKEQVLSELKPIRWIIYQAMFITVGLVVLASILFAVVVTRPILRIKNVVQKLAARNPETLARYSDRKDEIGMIARAIEGVSYNLMQDNQKLQDANRRQLQFYEDVAHELNNPLHALGGAIDMLELKGNDTASRSNYLQILRSHHSKMQALIKDILTLQRYGPEGKSAVLKPTALFPLVEEQVELYKDSFQAKGVKLLNTVDDLKVMADTEHLSVILTNLLTNALKYTDEGEVSIYTETENQLVKLCIKDTGIGVDPKHLPKLTQRFYRVDKDRARATGGTGLGLAIVEELVAAMEANLTIESTPGTGSVFCISLPIVLD